METSETSRDSDKPRFARLLRQYRENTCATHDERQGSRKALARTIGISVSYLSFLENERDPRLPKRHIVNSLADHFKLSLKDRNELLVAAGHKPVPTEAAGIVEEGFAGFASIFTGPQLTARETDLLLRELKSYALRWKSQRDARLNNVKKAIIAAAGWQAGLLSPEKLQDTISHSVVEILKAGIREIIVVIAPSKTVPSFRSLYDVAKQYAASTGVAQRDAEITVTPVIQEEPLGLGHAVSLCRTLVEQEPFAVVLPVDVDPSREALRRMKEAYQLTPKPMFAVNPRETVTDAELEHYGLAILGKRTERCKSLHYVDHIEKPVQPANRRPRLATYRIIMGRFILTPDIFDVLETTPRNLNTNKYEITDALAKLLKNHHFVCAYDLKQPFLPIASVRALMEVLVKSLTEPSVLSKMISATRSALKNIPSIPVVENKKR
ncbi:MAG TPA: sugar phosphate nucleotidyltransferase [Candidatus Acidoferrum sp.]|nr:sugar phosphate nucleotidyltransferase [Candidatus Acidoferrum sp.]